MLNLPSEFLDKCRNLFLTCSQFESYERLRSVFVTSELQPFRLGLKRADNSEDLVSLFLEFILEQELSGGEPVFPIFLKTLRNLYREGNFRRDQLTQLLEEAQSFLRPATSGPSLPRRQNESAVKDFQSSTSSAETRQPVQTSGVPSTSVEPNPKNPPVTGKIDFFISYNRHDKSWAEWIAWQLENSGYTTVIQAWDFRPGGNFVADMQKATTNSERTIAVLSPDYLTSLFTQPEWYRAFKLDPTGVKGLLLPVKVRECESDGLLPQIVYIDLTGLPLKEARQALLEGVIRGRVKPYIEPNFPGKGQKPEPDFPHSLTNEKPSV